MVVVSTKYDRLVKKTKNKSRQSNRNISKDEVERLAKNELQRLCVEPLKEAMNGGNPCFATVSGMQLESFWLPRKLPR